MSDDWTNIQGNIRKQIEHLQTQALLPLKDAIRVSRSTRWDRSFLVLSGGRITVDASTQKWAGRIVVLLNRHSQGDRLIGYGASKRVKCGLEVQTGEIYAITVERFSCLPEIMVTQMITTWQKTTQLAKMCQGPHIVDIIDSFKTKTKIISVMPYYQGGDLHDAILRSPSLKHTEVARDILRGVWRMHSLGVAHLDIKPPNILLDAAGRAFITDFEFAKHHSDPSEPKGTAPYFPPEMVDNQPFDTIQSDLWSLGITLIHLFTKQYLIEQFTTENLGLISCDKVYHDKIVGILKEFRYPKATETYQQLIDREISKNAKIPTEFKPIIMQLLRIHPKERKLPDYLYLEELPQWV